MKTYSRQFILIIFCFSFMLVSFGQQSVKKPVITKIAKFKPPVVTTYLGVNTNGAVITREEANQLITLPLKITDAKNLPYSIDSYQFLYKRRSVVENEESGRKQIAFTTIADRFKTTPLPKIWIDNTQNGFQKDEELYFFDIVVIDKAGRKFFAPDIKITIQ
ncbi:MAG: hypothetical protein ABIO81_02610 [Ginsengibacter sp.]